MIPVLQNRCANSKKPGTLPSFQIYWKTWEWKIRNEKANNKRVGLLNRYGPNMSGLRTSGETVLLQRKNNATRGLSTPQGGPFTNLANSPYWSLTLRDPFEIDQCAYLRRFWRPSLQTLPHGFLPNGIRGCDLGGFVSVHFTFFALMPLFLAVAPIHAMRAGHARISVDIRSRGTRVILKHFTPTF